MSPIDAHSPDALLEQVGWVRALARTLIRDEHAAEDLTQDTYVAALQRRPDDRRPLRGWLATVLRNLAVQHQRRATSRSTRERAAARGDESPPTVDVLQRAEKQRRIAEMVMALSEPYRTTVLLRFFDRLAPRDISRSMDVPVATVHSRLQRGLQMLRERIDARSERRQAWLSTLCIPVAGPAPKLMGALVVKSKTTLLLTAGALMLALGGIWFLPGEDAPPSGGGVDLQTARVENVVEGRQPIPIVTENERDIVVADGLGVEPTESDTATLARGRVLTIDGQPLADVGVRFSRTSGRGAVERLRSGLDGFFELELQEAVGVFEADDERYSTVMVAIARPRASGVSLLLVAPRLDFAGRIVDENGMAVAGAIVSIRSLRPTLGGQGMLLDASQPKPWNTRSDGTGRFDLSGTPQLSDASLEVLALGYVPHRQPAPGHTDRAIEVVLQRPDVGRSGIRGIVVSPEGWLVPNALVSHGTATGSTDAGGQFELPVLPEDRGAPLIAAKVDFQPAILPPQESFPDEVTLQLGPAPLKIQGQVVDADGTPMDDVKVWLAEPTYFGVIGRGPIWLEGLTLSLQPEFWTPALTDADGRFEIRGLLERSYRLRAMQLQTLLQATVEDVAAGTEVMITMPTDLLAEKITGTVVSMSGQPLSGIQLMHMVETLRKAPPDGWTQTAGEPGAAAMSDSEGRFEFRNVPRNAMTVLAHGDNVVPDQFELNEQDLMELQIVLEKLVHLQVELAGPTDRADEMRVLDVHEKPMEMFLLRAKRGQVNLAWPISEGRSPVVSIGETARSVELLKEGRRVALIPVTLLGDDVHVIRY